MGRHMEQYDKEYLKMAILNQDATFRQQVHELHRLYQVQQLLMGDIKSNKKKKIQKDAHNKTTLNLEMPAEEFGLELTLATGSSRSQKKKETSSCSDSGSSSFSSPSTGSEAMKRSSIEPIQVPAIDARFKHAMQSRFEMEERTRQDGLKQNPWFSQCLSLNTT
ncbi:hypothetical protein Cni_G10395 [Canna indica]|uniref:Uncharacterized protein n=1 Tax=Canna indica TaxID=4628 RepID=A0AAQ3QAA0_9LILI|nr:hypothetical protein Cni_G10395 [Canna indica]